VGISLTTDQILALAPDASSAAAGKKLANAKPWSNLGQNSEALWGECQGSALYQVKIDLSSMTIQCSCPSRKFPCKHGLGILLLAVVTPSAAPISEPPEWVTAWLAKRQAASKRRETKETSATTKTDSGPSTSWAKRAEKRRELVAQGLERLDLWLSDLVRNGLASVESQPATFWEQQAAQMIDAQAPGIAARLRSMAGIPNSSFRWPEKLLGQLGRLALLTEAYRQGEHLEAVLQEDVRQLIGWTLDQDEVAARGERITDDWLILGQVTDEEENGSRGPKAGKQRVRMQRTWLLGTQTGRAALVLQFSAAGAPFPEVYPLGACQVADVLFWPGAYPQRGRIEKRHGAWRAIQEPLPGAATVDAFFAGVAAALARQPWLERFLCALQQVVPVCSDDRWYIRDTSGTALPLTRGSHWKLLALSGGAAVDCAGEWDGETLLLLGVLVDGTYHLL
jgi:SWIM zinc finger